MYDFNSDMQTGYPQLDKDYWQKYNNQKEQNPIFDANTNNALKDISIFKVKK